MKNIIIIGVARAGKTTLSNMIKDRYNQYNVIHSDNIAWGIIRGLGKEEYYTEHIEERKEWIHGDKFQRILLEICKASISKDEKEYGTILDTGQLEPKYAKQLIDMGNVYCICLGHGTLDKQGIMNLCREHDTEKDWTYKIPDEQLEVNAKKWDEKNKLMRTECPKYGREYIDTSKERERVLSSILGRIDRIHSKNNEERSFDNEER